MTITEKKLDALMRFAAAENAADQQKVRREIRQLLVQEPAPVGESVEEAVCRILLDIGVPEHVLGYKRLVTAICAAVHKPDLLQAITGELYPLVADSCNTTPERVERTIRHAIELAFDRCDCDVLARYFGNTISYSKGKPTNSEFIARVSNIVRREVGTFR